jgi:hypothetical protein
MCFLDVVGLCRSVSSTDVFLWGSSWSCTDAACALLACMYMYIVSCYGTGDAVQFINWFYYNLTRRDYNYFLHCYLFTQLHANLFTLSAVVFTYSVSLSLKHLNSLQLFFTNELPVTVSNRELLCSADGLQDNPSARTPPLHSNGHCADPQKTSYVIASTVEMMVAEQQTINISPIVGCSSATEGCLQVVA